MPDPRQRFRVADVPDMITRQVVQSLADATARATQAANTASSATGGWFDVATGVGFQNGWLNYGAPYDTAAYVKNADGWVFIRGLVHAGTIALPVFTLPVGFRPPAQQAFGIASAGAGVLEIEAGGNVVITVGSNLTAQLWCVFRTL